MGSSASKASRLAGTTATKRKYPQRVPSPSAAAAPPQSARGTLSSSSSPSSSASSSSPSPAAAPTVHPNLQASASKTEAINLDASDPTFAQSLRTLGPVTPSSTFSNSSTFSSSSSHQQHQQNQNQHTPNSPSSSPQFPSLASNPALQILSARSRLAAEAEREFARAARAGSGSSSSDDDARRRFVDVVTLRQALTLRDRQSVPAEEIERRLGLERGVVGMLGRKGVVGDVAGDGLTGVAGEEVGKGRL